MAVTSDNTVYNNHNYNEESSRLTQFQESCKKCIKEVFNHVIAKCTAFSHQIEGLFLRIIYSDDWSLNKLTMVFYKKRLEILKEKKACLMAIQKETSEAAILLQEFHNLVKDSDERGYSRIKYFLGITEHCKDIINRKLKFHKNNLIDSQGSKNIKEREDWAKHVEPFLILTKKVDEISKRKFILEEDMFSNKRNAVAEDWNKLNIELKEAKNQAQTHYDTHLRDMTTPFKNWKIKINGNEVMYEIFESEKKFQDAVLQLLNIEEENMKKIKNGEPSSLNLMATELDLNEDRDMKLFQEKSKDIPEELLKLKIQDIEKDIEITEKDINNFRTKVKNRFKGGKLE